MSQGVIDTLQSVGIIFNEVSILLILFILWRSTR